MKELLKKVSRKVGGKLLAVGTAPEAPAVDKIGAVCSEMEVPRVDCMPIEPYRAACPPLFPEMTKIPDNVTFAAHKDAEEFAFNRSMIGYVKGEKRSDGVYITDAHPDSRHWARQRMIYAAVKELFGDSLLEEKTMIDIGCSSGYYCFHADRMGAKEVYGIDARPEHEEQFKILHGMVGANDSCHYANVDMEYGLEQLTDTYDFVSAQGVMYHVFDHPRFVKNLYRMSGDAVILEAACSGRMDEYCRAMIEDPKDLRESIHGPVLYPSLRWMIMVMRWAGFRDIRYINYPSDLPESARHNTLWRAMLIGRK